MHMEERLETPPTATSDDVTNKFRFEILQKTIKTIKRFAELGT